MFSPCESVRLCVSSWQNVILVTPFCGRKLLQKHFCILRQEFIFLSADTFCQRDSVTVMKRAVRKFYWRSKWRPDLKMGMVQDTGPEVRTWPAPLCTPGSQLCSWRLHRSRSEYFARCFSQFVDRFSQWGSNTTVQDMVKIHNICVAEIKMKAKFRDGCHVVKVAKVNMTAGGCVWSCPVMSSVHFYSFILLFLIHPSIICTHYMYAA